LVSSCTRIPASAFAPSQITCKQAGKPKDALTLSSVALPAELEWGEVLLSVRAAPVNPADLYTLSTGGLYGGDAVKPPFVAGHDGVAVVVKVRVAPLGVGSRVKHYLTVINTLIFERFQRWSGPP
jgi:NADPH:quinone reductase-like Zn-dependent oxidoreductase